MDIQRQFLATPLYVQRSDTGQVLITNDGLHRWVHAWWGRSPLARAEHVPDAAELDVALLTGAQLRAWLRCHHPDAGVVLHTSPDSEQIVLRPGRTMDDDQSATSNEAATTDDESRYSDLIAPARDQLTAADRAADSAAEVAAAMPGVTRQLREALGGDQGPPEVIRSMEDVMAMLGGQAQELAHNMRATNHRAAEMQRDEQRRNGGTGHEQS